MTVDFRSLEWRWANSVRWYLDRLVPPNGERLQSLDVARLVHKIFGVSVAEAPAAVHCSCCHHGQRRRHSRRDWLLLQLPCLRHCPEDAFCRFANAVRFDTASALRWALGGAPLYRVPILASAPCARPSRGHHRPLHEGCCSSESQRGH